MRWYEKIALALVFGLAVCGCSHPEVPMSCALESRAKGPCYNDKTKPCDVEYWVCAPVGYPDRKIIGYYHYTPEKESK